MELAVGIAAAVYKNDLEVAVKDSLKMTMKNYTINENDRQAWDKVQSQVKYWVYTVYNLSLIGALYHCPAHIP